MIVLEKSDEAIKGLAKLIIQEPRLIPELKLIRKKLEENNVLNIECKKDSYMDSQTEIIEKAEEIANKSIWYCFELYDNYHRENKGFMLYKRINNRMVPFEEDFENGRASKIRNDGDLEDTLVKNKIKNLVTYDPFDVDTVYSQQYEIESEEDENIGINHEHQHLSLQKNYIKYLIKKHGIKITIFNQSQVHEFEKELEFVNQIG